MATTKTKAKKELAKPDTFDYKTRAAFDWTQFTLKIHVEASPQKVWEAWTVGKKLSNWFPVEGVIEPKAGGRVWLQFFRPEDTLDDVVISAVKGKSVVFPFGSHGEQVEVRVIKHKKGAICELTQSRMRTTQRDKVYMHMGCRAGWTFFLTNLKSYLEHGIDLRSTDPKMTYREGFVNS